MSSKGGRCDWCREEYNVEARGGAGTENGSGRYVTKGTVEREEKHTDNRVEGDFEK